MNILFTLCGRAGSKGVKNKNLKTFLGTPLSYYSVAAIKLFMDSEEGKKHNIICVLNTDSEELIKTICEQNSVKFNVIERDETLGGDAVPKVAVIKDCLYKMEAQYDISLDMVVDIDITSPIRGVNDITNAIITKSNREDTDVVYSVTGARRNPYFNMVKKENNYFCKAVASEYVARQQAPEMYDMNASIYAYSVRALKNKQENTFFNSNCDAIIMRDTGVLDIDSEEDFELMQVIAKYFYDNYEEYGEIREMACGLLR